MQLLSYLLYITIIDVTWQHFFLWSQTGFLGIGVRYSSGRGNTGLDRHLDQKSLWCHWRVKSLFGRTVVVRFVFLLTSAVFVPSLDCRFCCVTCVFTLAFCFWIFFDFSGTSMQHMLSVVSTATLYRCLFAFHQCLVWRKCDDSRGLGPVERPLPPALKGHFSADCSSANIMNIVRP